MFLSRAGRPYNLCIGLEVHVLLLTASKLLSGAAASGPPAPNVRVSPFDAAHPGTLPRLNRAAVEQALRAALVLRCAIPRASSFQRKHYFYADLPHGYQVTQLDAPIARAGFLRYQTASNTIGGGGGSASRVARIARLQLETDAGKSQHGGGDSRIDLNRAGAPLLEVVTEPDFSSAEEAEAFLRCLQAELVHAGVTRGAMEEGELRVDVNVSLRAAAAGGGLAQEPGVEMEALEEGEWRYVDAARRVSAGALLEGAAAAAARPLPPAPAPRSVPPLAWYWHFHRPTAAAAALAWGRGAAVGEALLPAARGFGARVEAKNLNSLRGVGACIRAEGERQAAELEAGHLVQAETRGWDAARGVSTPLRGKGGAADYRFLPEADVEPILVPRSALQGLLRELPPPLPVLRRELVGSHGLREEEADAIAGAPGLALAYLAVVRGAEEAAGEAAAGEAGAAGGLRRACASWLCTELAGQLRACREAAERADWGMWEDVGGGGLAATVAARPGLARHLGRLVWLVHSGAVSGRAGKIVLSVMLARDEGEGGPEGIVQERGLEMIRDEETVKALCRAAVARPELAGAAEKWRCVRLLRA